MSKSFDPYLNWLGIRDPERPPNHYRLLGVEPFEANPDVIANAADRQMAYVRTFQSGKHLEVSQRILNELAAAKLFLLKPEKKAVYDARLRAKLASAPPVKPVAKSAPPKQQQRPGPDAAAVIPAVDLDTAVGGGSRSTATPPRSHAVRARRPQRALLITALAGTVLAALLGVAAVVVVPRLFSSGDNLAQSSLTSNGDASDHSAPEDVDTTPAVGGENWDDITPSADDLVVGDAPGTEDSEAPRVPEQDDSPAAGREPSSLSTAADILLDAALPAPTRRPLAEPLTAAVDTTLATTRAAMAMRNLTLAEDRLARAGGQAVTHADRDAVARTRSVLTYLKQCWNAARREIGRLSPGDQLAIGTTPVTVVKVTPNELAVQADGKRRSFALAADQIEASLIAALARRGLARSGPHAQAALAAFWASDRDGDPGRALAYSRFAGERGVPVEMLQEELELDYSLPVPILDPGADTSDVTDVDVPFEPAAAATSATTDSQPRTAVPDANATRDAVTKIRGIFSDEYRKAATSQARIALARMLRSHAGKTADDDVGRYALFSEARSIAQREGESALAMEITDEMARSYGLNLLEEKASVLEAMVRTVRSADGTRELLDQVAKLREQTATDEKFAMAEQLADTAIAVARKLKNRNVLKQAVARKNQIKDQAKDFETAKRAYLSLRAAPEDAQANLTAGRYLCLTRGDWKRGLPLLAKSGEEKLAATAKADLSAQRGAKGEAATGDLWWDLAQAARGTDKLGHQARAGHWYQKALEKSPTGLSAVQIKKRLAEIEQAKFQAGMGDRTPGQFIDLLALVNPEQHTENPSNSWVRKGTSISTGQKKNSQCFRLPVTPQGDYELLVEYEQMPIRAARGNYILIHLPNARNSCDFLLATAPPNKMNGLGMVDGKYPPGNDFSFDREATPGRHTAYFQVLSRGENVAILARLDGQILGQWQVVQQRLSTGTAHKLSNPRAFAIATYIGNLVIYQAKLRMLSGRAVRVP